MSPASYSEESVKDLVAHPMVMIASDGMWLTDRKAHPRTFGTYARVLGRYVREQRALGLMDALKKMTVLPADRLSKRVPSMKKKGRVQVGADADNVVFDPETIIDRATYQDPAQYSTGIDHVVVNGTVTTLQILALQAGAEMLTQRTPFEAAYEQVIAYGILNEEPEPVTAQRGGLPVEIDQVISKTLAKGREDRYQQAS